jgi:8-oxo-dGTP pyrophosphatase MutT (NUDIX family)
MKFLTELENYIPYNEQEQIDKEIMLYYAKNSSHILERKNHLVHMSASCWILNSTHTKVLFAYHKIYQSWTWTGGHADGEDDLLAVALKEAREETGLTNIKVLSPHIFSIENLCVNGHWKHNEYVTSHLHLNITYLLEADEADLLVVNEAENNGLKWFTYDEALQASSEEWMNKMIFEKLIEKSKKGL